MTEETILEIQHIKKSFDQVEVIKNISLSVQKGEFITILGPSGCGKTTTLRIIAGLEEPDSGQVILENKDVTMATPNQRNVNTVFQSYALFPHMTVYENVAYSQKLKKVPKKEQQELVRDALELVQLEGFEDRLPSQLSGGQSQRVAIARAVINQPKVLLLDEPLGALDLRLRQQMQIELKSLQQHLGITFIYITHDQEEALNMSDRIVVMNQGKFEQIGTPMEVYNQPQTAFVADFIGAANLLTGTVIDRTDSQLTFQNENGTGIVSNSKQMTQDGHVTVAIRGENINWEKSPTSQAFFEGTVTEKVFQGGFMRLSVTLSNGSILYIRQLDVLREVNVGDLIGCFWKPDKAVLVRGEKE